MALLNQYVVAYGQLGKLFEAVKKGQAPEKFTRQYLKDLGFTSSNHLAFIPLLKGLGFLQSDGSPTQRYRDFLDNTKSWKVLAEAVKEAYSDIFTLRAKPGKQDREVIQGKFRSTYNSTKTSADRLASTFLALLDLCDTSTLQEDAKIKSKEDGSTQTQATQPASAPVNLTSFPGSFHYNIQIHLPASKDIEVFNAIFKALREHIIE